MGYPKLNSPDNVLPPRVCQARGRHHQPDGAAIGASEVATQASYLGRGSAGARTDCRALRARRARRPIDGAAPEDAAPKDQPFDQQIAQSPVVASAVGDANAHRGAHRRRAAPNLDARRHVMARRDQDAVVHRRSRRKRAIADSQSVPCFNHSARRTGLQSKQAAAVERSSPSPRLTRSTLRPAARK